MMALLSQRTPREKALLGCLAALGLIWLAVTQVWQPLQALRHEIAARIPRIERALALVQSNPVALPAPDADADADARSLPIVITEAADSFGLTINRLQPEGGRVRVTLEDAPFDAVLLWVEALQRDHALRPIDLTLTRRPTPGVVATNLMVER